MPDASVPVLTPGETGGGDVVESLLQLFMSDSAEAIARRRDDTQLATARQRDGAGQDMRVVGGMIAKELLVSDSPDDMSRLNAAVRIPTTLDHPSNPAVP